MKSSSSQPTRRGLFKFAAFWIFSDAASAMPSAVAGNSTDAERNFKDIGVVLVVDAVLGAEMRGVTFYDDRGREIYGSATLSKRNREILALGGSRVPRTVRAIWRDKPKPIWGKNGGIDYEGALLGDYTIPVAERIPDEVLADIRLHGGALRLKFRLQPGGVLFGWDIERPGGGISKFDMPGGDFLDTRY